MTAAVVLGKLLRIARLSAELLGWATAVSLVWFTIRIHQYEHRNHRRYATGPVRVSPVAARIAARFSPKIQQLAAEHRAEVVAAAGGPLQRWCVGQVYGPAVDAIPYAVEVCTDRALSQLLDLPVEELAGDLISHAQATGRQVDYRVWAASEQGRRPQIE
jgi:hypothetical protein